VRVSWKHVALASLALIILVGGVLVLSSGSDESSDETVESESPAQSEPPSSIPSGFTNIYTIDVDSGSIDSITDNAQGELAAGPAWSDRGKIVFGEASSGERLAHLFVINADGTGRKRIQTSISHLFQPTWAPDGRRVAVVRLGSGIYVIDVASGSAHRVTRDESDDGPAWSPDGRTIAFTRQVTSTNPELHRVNASGGGIRRLTRDRFQQSNPAWSPDGSRIVFAEQQTNGNWGLVSMGLDGSDRKLLTSLRISCQDPAWSPDGKKVAFVLQESSGESLAVVDASGGTPRRLDTKKLIQVASPSWSPNSKKIVFAARSAARPPPTPAPGAEQAH
jgi:Tol biopolymer transport system component